MSDTINLHGRLTLERLAEVQADLARVKQERDEARELALIEAEGQEHELAASMELAGELAEERTLTQDLTRHLEAVLGEAEALERLLGTDGSAHSFTLDEAREFLASMREKADDR